MSPKRREEAEGEEGGGSGPALALLEHGWGGARGVSLARPCGESNALGRATSRSRWSTLHPSPCFPQLLPGHWDVSQTWGQDYKLRRGIAGLAMWGPARSTAPGASLPLSDNMIPICNK